MHLLPREIFEVWAPENSVWSPWAKPVIFAQIRRDGAEIPSPENFDYNAYWAPHAAERTALIINLPADESIRAGLALVGHGYRPVPLYNTSHGDKAVINLEPIITGLVTGTGLLQSAFVEDQAPPAFLLDSNRIKGILPPTPGMYDNRWVVWSQDFPSATFLRSKEIERVMVIQNGAAVQQDLAQVLTRWKRDGIEVLIQDIPSRAGDKAKVDEKAKIGDELVSSPDAARIVPFTASPWLAFWMWTRLLLPASLGMRRSSVGGFGGIVPTPSSGG